jgi:predicted transcriptional regulator
MEATIKIISCSRVESWYKHRIGETFSAIIKNGTAWINNNPIFKVKQSEYLVVENTEKKQRKTRYLIVLKILEKGDMTVDEINHEYFRTHGNTDYQFIKNMLGFLVRDGRIIKTGLKRVGHTGYSQSVYSLNNSEKQ